MAAITLRWTDSGFAGDARTRRRRMAAAAKLRGDFVHVHPVAFGAEADAGHSGFDLLKDTRDHDRLDGADVVNQTFGVSAFRAGAGKISLLQPEPRDAVVGGQTEFAVNVLSSRTRESE